MHLFVPRIAFKKPPFCHPSVAWPRQGTHVPMGRVKEKKKKKKAFLTPTLQKGALLVQGKGGGHYVGSLHCEASIAPSLWQERTPKRQGGGVIVQEKEGDEWEKNLLPLDWDMAQGESKKNKKWQSWGEICSEGRGNNIINIYMRTNAF